MNEDTVLTLYIIFAILVLIASVVLTYVFHKKIPILRILPSLLLSIPMIYGYYLYEYGETSSYLGGEQLTGVLILIFSTPVFFVCTVFALVLFLYKVKSESSSKQWRKKLRN